MKRQGKIQDISIHKTDRPPSVEDDATGPDPEVCEKRPRRHFTASYKLRILKEFDTCTHPEKKGALLSREGLYHSNICTWSRQREKGELQGLSPKKRGRPLAKRVAQLERENRRLNEKLRKAETIIEVQKKYQRSWAFHNQRT
jgi:transposase